MRQNLPIQVNTFVGGMNQDAASEKIAPSQYLYANNVQLLSTDAEASEFSVGEVVQSGRMLRLSNLKGHTDFLEFPDVPAQGRFEVCYNLPEDPDADYEFIVEITLANTPPAQFTVASPTGWAGFQTALEANPTFAAAVGLNLNCGTCVVLVSRDWANQITLVTATDSVGPFTPVFPTVTDVSFPAQTDVQLIGWAYGANQLVLFTTAQANTAPLLDPALHNVGQIWLADVSDHDNAPPFGLAQLKYNDRTNFALENQIQAIYFVETDCVARVFWTDRYETLRNMNIAPAGLLTPPPGLLGINPEFQFGAIDFLGFVAGELDAGVYQYSYRLVTADGNRTSFFPLTTHIICLPYAPNPNLMLNGPQYSYAASGSRPIGEDSARGHRLQFSGIDTNFAELEIIAVYSLSLAAPPASVLTVGILPITGSVMTFIHTSETTAVDTLSILEVLAPRISIDSVTAIAEANNRLVAANICENIGATFDDKLTTFGGDITHDFITRLLISDQVMGKDYSGTGGAKYGQWEPNKRSELGHATFSVNFNDMGEVGLNTGTPNPFIDSDFVDYKGAATEHYFRGYFPDEKYRWGIVLFYKDGTRSAAFWIGDVDFPKIGDAITGDPDLYFPTKFKYDPLTYQYPLAYLKPLAIKFGNIDMSAVKDDIIGFSIVRSKRDPVILGYGLAYMAHRRKSEAFPPFEANTTKFLFASPEFDFEGFNYKNGDILHSYAVVDFQLPDAFAPLDPVTDPRAYASEMPATLGFLAGYVAKFYNLNTIAGVPTFTDDVIKVGQASYNKNDAVPTPILAYQSVKGTIAPSSSPYPYIDPGKYYYDAPDEGVYRYPHIAAYKRPVALQYGGTDEAAIRSSQYILTGHYQPVDACNKGDGNYVYNDVEVWGGDCFLTNYSRRSASLIRVPAVLFPVTDIVYFAAEPPPNTPESLFGYGYAMMFPVYSRINTTVRFATNQQFGEGQGGSMFWEISEFNSADGRSDADSFRNECFEYSDVMSHEENVGLIAAYDPNVACQVCNTNALIASDENIIGEKINGYAVFRLAERQTVSLQYGAITHIASIARDVMTIYFWQPGGFGVIPVGQRNLQIRDLTQVVLGTGEFFGDPVYRSEEYGCSHKWGIVRGNNSFWWVDVVKKRLYNFVGDQLTDVTAATGLVSFFEANLQKINLLDNPVYKGGIHGIWDYKHNELLLTRKYNYEANGAPCEEPADCPDIDWTLVLNSQTKAFASFQSTRPGIYIGLPGNRTIAPNPADEQRLYEYYKNPARNLFFGAAEPVESSVCFVVNQGNQVTKIPAFFVVDVNDKWDSLELESNTLHDAYGGAYRLRGKIPASLWTPRGGKWQVQAPRATDVYRETPVPGWAADSILTVMQGEQILVRLGVTTTEARDVFDVTTYLTQARINS